jgi:hypothetical protein
MNLVIVKETMLADPLVGLNPGYPVSWSSRDWKTGDPQVSQIEVFKHVVPRI